MPGHISFCMLDWLCQECGYRFSIYPSTPERCDKCRSNKLVKRPALVAVNQCKISGGSRRITRRKIAV